LIVGSVLLQFLDMTVEKIRDLLRASPFQSFEVHTPDGRAFKVPRPDFAMLSGTGRLLHVARPETDEEDIIDIALITDIALPAKAEK
jgi:hypothetical protein